MGMSIHKSRHIHVCECDYVDMYVCTYTHAYITVLYITLHYITLHYVTLHYIA